MATATVPTSEDILRSKLADVRALLTRFEQAAAGGADTEFDTAMDDMLDSLWAVQEYRSRMRGQWSPDPSIPSLSLIEMHQTGCLPVWTEDASDNG